MSTALKRLSVDEYLAIERASETKSEFFDGEMFAMAGATANHNLIVTSVGAGLLNALRGRCRVYSSDLKVRSPRGLYTYPDISVSCDAPQLEDDHADVLLNPVLVVEVLSPSTEAYDRGKKFEHYRTIASLKTYVLVSQDHANVDMFTRQSDGRWLLTSIQSGELRIPNPECVLRLDDIYDQIEFPSIPTEPTANGQ